MKRKTSGKAKCHLAFAVAIVTAITACPFNVAVSETLTSCHGIAEFKIEKSVSCGVGDVIVSCREPNGWRFAADVVAADGRDVVTIRLSSDSEIPPPQFDVTFSTSGADALHVWTPFDERCQLWPIEWGKWRYESELAFRAPIASAFNERDDNRLTISCSEALRKVYCRLGVDSKTCVLHGGFRFFAVPEAPMSSYEVKILIDRRDVSFGDAVKDASKWISDVAGLSPAFVPESAFDPLYSTRYAFWQDVHASVLEREVPIAAALGMKTMILDDGWQKEQSHTYYSATGDWKPVASRFPNMKNHVDTVHAAGLRYMLWLSVPFVGNESEAWNRFRNKCLYVTDDGVGRHDPRFPEVRDYLIATYEHVVGEWGFDGVKLDFIDEFRLGGRVDLAVAQGYAGRDIRSLPEAVDRLMRDVAVRLRKIRPDVLIEFRQQYMGPAIRQYGNMIRATDCPADLAANRRRIADLRLTSGETAVHSDMLVWSEDEAPENASRAVLSAIFGVVQYSMVLQKLPESHRKMMRHWIGFSLAHRDALLKGGFRPHHPEMQYPWIESWNDKEHIVAVYSDGVVLPVDAREKTVFVLNASQLPSVVIDVKSEQSASEVFDTFGALAGRCKLKNGLNRVSVPVGGYIKMEDAR